MFHCLPQTQLRGAPARAAKTAGALSSAARHCRRQVAPSCAGRAAPRPCSQALSPRLASTARLELICSARHNPHVMSTRTHSVTHILTVLANGGIMHEIDCGEPLMFGCKCSAPVMKLPNASQRLADTCWAPPPRVVCAAHGFVCLAVLTMSAACHVVTATAGLVGHESR